MSNNKNYLIGQFAKYHGNGNDFIIINHTDKSPDLSKLISLSKSLCDRHRGIGADGILVLSPTSEGLHMVVINSDGSLAQNCGNGLRCAARWYFDTHNNKREVSIYLASKNYLCVLEGENISVQIGLCHVERLKNMNFGVLEAQCFKAQLGNNHLVFIFAKPDLDLNLKLVTQVQKEFPDAHEYNLGFVTPCTQGYYSRVFERGVGFTKSCGSGACAAGAALSMGYEQGQERNLELSQPGGPIWVDAHVLENKGCHARFLLKLAGPAQAIFLGVL